MKHIHHIIPKYMGGSDDPENLIELTVEEHAEAHRLLYEKHGNWQDNCAYLALSGQITLSEAALEAMRQGGSKAITAYNESLKGITYEDRYGTEKALEVKQKISESSLTRDWSITEEERVRRSDYLKQNNPNKTNDPLVKEQISKTLSKGLTLQHEVTGEIQHHEGLCRWAKANDLKLPFVASRFRRGKSVNGWKRIFNEDS